MNFTSGLTIAYREQPCQVLPNALWKTLPQVAAAEAILEFRQEALAHLDVEKPDLVVLDVVMPGMDGVEALGRILSKEPTIPVILHSAYSRYRDNFMTWSADAYVVKSADLTELMSTVHGLLDHCDSASSRTGSGVPVGSVS